MKTNPLFMACKRLPDDTRDYVMAKNGATDLSDFTAVVILLGVILLMTILMAGQMRKTDAMVDIYANQLQDKINQEQLPKRMR